MKLLLCDTVIIIDAHELGLWNVLKSHYKIHIASTVLKESQHFRDGLQVKHYFDFKKDIISGRIIKISITIEEIQAVIKKALENRLDIQVGEAESLAALLKPEYQQVYFCTADKAAIATAHLYDVMPRVVSLEKCLDGIKSCKLPYKLTKKAMRRWKKEAIQRIG